MKSKREQKRRLAYLRTLSKEELMQLYYLQQEKRANIHSTQIERNAFDICKGVRNKRKVRNTCYREEAGTCRTYVRTMRFENSYITKVCKSRNLY